MKQYIDQIIVVEGRGDESYLSSFIDALYVVTNGNELAECDIAYLKQVKDTRGVIVLVDPDDAGKQIRNRINSKIEGLINVELDINKCNKHGKHGVKECDKEEILLKLKPFIKKEKKCAENPIDKNLIVLLNSKETRKNLSSAFNLGTVNNKTLIKRLESLNITNEQIKRIICK